MSDKRIIELETKLAFMEQSVNDLSTQVYDQQQTIEELRTWCRTLAERLAALREGDDQDTPAGHEVPPHY